jgi:ribosomal protein S1
MEVADHGAGVVLEGGQRVRVRVRSHRHYGLFVDLVGHEGITGSIDWWDIAGPDRGRSRRDDFPIGTEVEAVIRRRLGPSPEVRRRRHYLMIP